MAAYNESRILTPDGAVDRKRLRKVIGRLASAGDSQSLSNLLRAVTRSNPGTFSKAYALFEPVLVLLDFKPSIAQHLKLDTSAIVAEWASTLGLMKPHMLNAMLAQEESLVRAAWFMRVGADPNAVLDPESPEKLTVIGHVCRVLGQRKRMEDDDPERAMIAEILARGEVPYSVRPRYEGDPDACDLFVAVCTNIASAGVARSVLLEAAEQAVLDGKMPDAAADAVGKMCLAAEKLTEYYETWPGRGISFRMLSCARFVDPKDWVAVCAKIDLPFDRLLQQNFIPVMRVLNALVRGCHHPDQVQVCITEDRIPCTLLQAAAYCGFGWAVTELINAGADPARTVGAGSERHQIADLDAKGLWEINPKHGRSQAIEAAAAKNAIESILSQARAPGRPHGS